jgi:hypothetical protein
MLGSSFSLFATNGKPKVERQFGTYLKIQHLPLIASASSCVRRLSEFM